MSKKKLLTRRRFLSSTAKVSSLLAFPVIVPASALGADGVILGTAELIALGCTRCSNCERGRGCPFGLTTTDPELSLLVKSEWGAQRISNLNASYAKQLRHILRGLGLKNIRDLRGRTDLLVYQND